MVCHSTLSLCDPAMNCHAGRGMQGGAVFTRKLREAVSFPSSNVTWLCKARLFMSVATGLACTGERLGA